MEFIYRENEIVLESPEGKTLARVTFPALDAETVELDHTFVDDSLRGQGVAGKLLEAAVAELRKRGLKAVPTCSYAVKWFGKHPEYADRKKGVGKDGAHEKARAAVRARNPDKPEFLARGGPGFHPPVCKQLTLPLRRW